MLGRCRAAVWLHVACLLAFSQQPVGNGTARRIGERLLAPCCWRENINIHQSGEAAQLRAEIAAMVAAGKTEDQIVDAFVARYGERILREPRGGKNLALTAIPVALIGLATAALIGYLYRRAKAPSPV